MPACEVKAEREKRDSQESGVESRELQRHAPCAMRHQCLGTRVALRWVPEVEKMFELLRRSWLATPRSSPAAGDERVSWLVLVLVMVVVVVVVVIVGVSPLVKSLPSSRACRLLPSPELSLHAGLDVEPIPCQAGTPTETADAMRCPGVIQVWAIAGANNINQDEDHWSQWSRWSQWPQWVLGLGRSPPLSPRPAVHWARASPQISRTRTRVAGAKAPIYAAAEPPARRILCLDLLHFCNYRSPSQQWRPGRPGRLDLTQASSSLAPSVLTPPRPRTPLPPHPLTQQDRVTPSLCSTLGRQLGVQGVAGREGSSLKPGLNTARLSPLWLSSSHLTRRIRLQINLVRVA
ncbi:hypothetical protein EDB80DRAFT_679257 [Ilyonectria destructans]|nr:hypothetical protein EDB80DRAFT_679257 [Ilyonectria destructans]